MAATIEIEPEVKHTPQHSTGDIRASGNGVHRMESERYGQIVAIAFDPDSPDKSTDVTHANAEFIARAFMSHDQLVAAARKALSVLEEICNPNLTHLEGDEEVRDELRAALAAATGANQCLKPDSRKK